MRIYYDPRFRNGDGYTIQPYPYPTGAIQIPLPSGQTIGVTVTPSPSTPAPNTPATPAAGENETIAKAREWLQQQNLIAGWPNWQVVGGAALLLMFVGGRK